MIRQINIPPVTFDMVFKKVSEMFPDLMEKSTNYIADQAYAFWRNRALTEPKRKDGSPSLWGEKYAETLKVEKSTDGKGAKVFVDENHPSFMFVELVENGVTVWSIKNALLSGKAARRNKALYGTVFVRVPFRYRVPGVSKETSTFAGIMPKDIYNTVKKGVALGKEYGRYAGLVKMGGPLHSQYMTFRTVTESSQGWFYPSKPAVDVFQKVKKKVEQMIEETVENIITGFLRDLQKEMS
jgi:hypothetical protein